MTASPSHDVLLPEQPVPNVSASRFTRTLNRLQPSPEAVVLMLAVLIGGGAGMGVVTFHYLIELIHTLMLEDLMGAIASWGPWTLACVPTFGGLIVGLMRWRWRSFGPGFSSLIAAVQGEREVSPLRPVAKMVAASVSLGTGASLGPEGPSVEIGASFGVLLGQVLQVSQERQRVLLGAGAAAGLAAGFNAPIAGVFFALEVVLGTTFATSAVSVVLLAAVVAALVAQIGLGAQPAFTLPVYEVRSPLELPLYLGLGLFASLTSVIYTRAIKLAQHCFQGKVAGLAWLESKISPTVHPIIGGAFVGLVALQWPQILGVGYETVEAILQDVQFSLPLLLVLLVVKLAMTAVSLGSGLVGGIFAPAMFLGAALGAAYGKIAAAVLPATVNIAGPPAYAMVGMAAVLAGSVRAPLTAILLLFELTRDYRIVLPLMAAVGLSVWLIERFQAKTTPGLDLQQMGMNMKKNPDLDAFQHLPVAAAMNSDFLRLPATMSVLEAGLALTSSRSHSALVIEEDERLIGIVTLQDINRATPAAETALQGQIESGALIQNLIHQRVSEICTAEILYAYPDESIAEALSRMAARGLHQLPVVTRNEPHQVIGLLDQEGINLACSLEFTRQTLRPHLSLLSVAQEMKEIPLPTMKQSA